MSAPLPDELVAALRRARRVELVAANLGQMRQSVEATGRLMLAAVNAGWKGSDVSRALGLKPGTGQKRIAAARDRVGDAPSGLVIDERPRRLRRLHERLAAPVEHREWLTTADAAARRNSPELLDHLPQVAVRD